MVRTSCDPESSSARSIQRHDLSLAPMLDYTDVYFRLLCRILSRHTVLYTEMVVDTTIFYNPISVKDLYLPPNQHPCVLQLGGSDPVRLARVAKVAETYGYSEINLNCGCPSDRVAGKGCFGASLMKDPRLVARCMAAMRQAVSVECTVKCRLGVDNIDKYEQVCNFIHHVSTLGQVKHFIIHARKCHLKGLNPAQNRNVPPLRHSWVFALKRDFPHLDFTLNGGIKTLEQARKALDFDADGAQIAGVMIGRGIQHNPVGVLCRADTQIFGEDADPCQSRREVLQQYAEGCAQINSDLESLGLFIPKLRVQAKPITHMCAGVRGTKRWRRLLDEILTRGEVETMQELVQTLVDLVPADIMDTLPPEEVAEQDEFVFEDMPEVWGGRGEELQGLSRAEVEEGAGVDGEVATKVWVGLGAKVEEVSVGVVGGQQLQEQQEQQQQGVAVSL